MTRKATSMAPVHYLAMVIKEWLGTLGHDKGEQRPPRVRKRSSYHELLENALTLTATHVQQLYVKQHPVITIVAHKLVAAVKMVKQKFPQCALSSI